MRRAAVLAVIAFCAITCSRFDYYRETYETGKMARDFGAFQRGLVPAFVPDDARDVTLANNHVTGAAWMRCELPESGLPKILASVTHVGWIEARQHSEAAPDWIGDWHPVIGQQALLSTPGGSSVYFIYRDASREWHGVITPSRICYAYRLPSSTDKKKPDHRQR